MAFPPTLPTLTVTTGPWITPGGGAPLKGRILRLRPERAVYDPTSGTPVTADAIDIVLDELGRGEQTVPAGQWYVLSFLFGFGVSAPEPRRIFLPHDVETVDLDQLLAIVVGGQTVYLPVVTSVAGLSGQITAAALVEALGGELGAVPDGSVTPVKLSFDPATQTELQTVADAAAAASAIASSAATAAASAGQAALDARARANHTGTQAAATISGLANVATSGAYGDLSGRPVIPAGYTDEQAQDAAAALLATGAHAGISFVYDDATGALAATVNAGGTALSLSSTQTAPYTAKAGEIAMMNVASGATTLTLPSNPANKTQVGFRSLGATTAVPLTITRAGTDTIGDAGATSVTEPLSGVTRVYQFDSPSKRWLPVTDVKPLTALDNRYVQHGAELANEVVASATVRAAFVTLAGTDPASVPILRTAGDGRIAVWEYINNNGTNGGGYLWHLLSGAASAGNTWMFGYGGDGGQGGFAILRNKAAGIALKNEQLSSITSPTAYGQYWEQHSQAPVLCAELFSDGTAPLAQFLSYNTAAMPLVKWQGQNGKGGSVRANDGSLLWDATDIAVINGGMFRGKGASTNAQDNQSKLKNIELQFSSYSGSGDTYWHKRVRGAGQSMFFEFANNLAGGVDAAPTYTTALQLKNVSGVNQLGFFGVSPVAQPAATPAAATDLATALTLVNSLRAALFAVGLVA